MVENTNFIQKKISKLKEGHQELTGRGGDVCSSSTCLLVTKCVSLHEITY